MSFVNLACHSFRYCMTVQVESAEITICAKTTSWVDSCVLYCNWCATCTGFVRVPRLTDHSLTLWFSMAIRSFRAIFSSSVLGTRLVGNHVFLPLLFYLTSLVFMYFPSISWRCIPKITRITPFIRVCLFETSIKQQVFPRWYNVFRCHWSEIALILLVTWLCLVLRTWDHNL